MTDKKIQESFRWRHTCLPWYPRKGKREDVAVLFKELGFTKGVEVGTQYGRFAYVLLTSNPGLHLTCVDPWLQTSGYSQEKQELIYQNALERLKGLNCTIVRKKSMEAVKEFEDGSLDFAYIDADHSFDNCALDIIHWTQKVRKGGIIACHDYNNITPVGLVIDGYTRSHDIRPWYITRELGATAFWVVK